MDYDEFSCQLRLGVIVIVMGVIASLGVKIFMTPPSQEIFRDNVDNQLVSYRVAQSSWFGVRRGSDEMVLYDGSSQQQIIEDSDRDGIIGNVTGDKYTISAEGNEIVYASNFLVYTDRLVYGDKRFSIDGTELEKRVVEEISRPKLEEATRQYQEIKNKIQAALELKLR